MPPRSCPEGSDPVVSTLWLWCFWRKDSDRVTQATASITIPAVPTITPPPTPPTDVVFTTYTYTITWYYYFYYYYYVGAATSLTSSTITTQTTISVSATDSAAALASFSAISATISLPTPVQSATSISGSPAPITYPTVTPSYTPSPPVYNTSATSGPEPTYSEVPLNAASSLTPNPGWGVAILGLAFFLPAVLMVVL